MRCISDVYQNVGLRTRKAWFQYSFSPEEVIGMTITGCAKNWDMLKKLGIKIVICEEAGEVMEAQTLCTLFPTVEHAISIGDPLQLR